MGVGGMQTHLSAAGPGGEKSGGEVRRKKRNVCMCVSGRERPQVSVFPAAFLRGSVFSPSSRFFRKALLVPAYLKKSQTHTHTSTHTRMHALIHLPSIPHGRPSLFGQGSGVPEKLSQMC